MQRLDQSPTDPAFVQDPYPLYAAARARGPVLWWEQYGLPAVFDHRTVAALLRDRRLGREAPAEIAQDWPAHLAPFAAIERHSMLEAEPPRHGRLRGQVLRAFTSRRVAALRPEIEALAEELIDAFPRGEFDLIDSFCTPIPVRIIARLLGLSEACCPDLLRWSHAMVAMYQAGRTRQIEDAAARASAEFADFLRAALADRRAQPEDDLLTALASAPELDEPEVIATAILLLNAGHEATVHALGNSVKLLLERDGAGWLAPQTLDAAVEECLRLDPPLHMFTRYAYEDLDIGGHRLRRGEQVALILGAANRDPAVWADPDRFDPARPARTHAGFGGGIHFCLGAPLARLEMQAALPILFRRCPGLRLAGSPRYAGTYHFRGLEALRVRC